MENWMEGNILLFSSWCKTSWRKKGSGEHPDAVQCRQLPAPKPMCPHVPVSLLQLRKRAKCREIKLLLTGLHPQGWWELLQRLDTLAQHFATCIQCTEAMDR